MTKEDLRKIIAALKTEAVGRCRERLEDAASRAKKLVNCERNTTGYNKTHTPDEEHGVTMLLKRKHGL